MGYIKWISIAVVSLMLTSPAMAQNAPCGDRADFLEGLAKRYNEHPVAMGMTDRGGVLEVLASLEGTWTFLVTMPNGITCMVAMGKNWEILSPGSHDSGISPADRKS